MDIVLVMIGLTTAASVALLTFQMYRSVFYPQRAIRARMVAARAGDTSALAAPLLRPPRMAIPFLDLPPRVREYMLLRFAFLFGFFAASVIALGQLDVPGGVVIAGSLAFGLVGWYLPRMYVSRRRQKRLELVEKQLPEALTAMAKALKAGNGLLQALARAADETPAPLGS